MKMIELMFSLSMYPIIHTLIIKKQTSKFPSANFQKMLSPRYIILRI